MNAAVLVRSARADGLKLAVSEAGAVKLSGSRSAVDRWAPAITSNKPDIVALLRQEAAAISDNSAVDNAAEYHRRRIAAKEADLAFQGLGPDGSTPLAEYRRLAAEGAKTAKAIRDAALAAGHESLSKAANTPAPTNGPWPEPKITRDNPPFGVDNVPSRYEAGWQVLLTGCPPWAAEWQWAEAIFSCRDLFSEWGAELLRLHGPRNGNGRKRSSLAATFLANGAQSCFGLIGSRGTFSTDGTALPGSSKARK